MPEIVEESHGVHVFLTLAMIFYSLYILITGIWGYSILPSTCGNLTLRSSLRSLIVTGAMSCTAYVSYLLCQLNCRKSSNEYTGDKVVKVSDTPIPNFIIFFSFALSIANIIFQAKVQGELSTSDPGCDLSSLDSYKPFNSLGIALSVLNMLGMLGVGLYRMRESSKKKRTASANAITKRMASIFKGNQVTPEDEESSGIEAKTAQVEKELALEQRKKAYREKQEQLQRAKEENSKRKEVVQESQQPSITPSSKETKTQPNKPFVFSGLGGNDEEVAKPKPSDKKQDLFGDVSTPPSAAKKKNHSPPAFKKKHEEPESEGVELQEPSKKKISEAKQKKIFEELTEPVQSKGKSHKARMIKKTGGREVIAPPPEQTSPSGHESEYTLHSKEGSVLKEEAEAKYN